MDIGLILGKLGFDLRVFLFNLVNIVVLIFLMQKFIVIPVLNILKERKKLIEEGFDREKEATKLLDTANLEAKQIISNAIDESEKIISNAKEQSVKQAENILDSAYEKADKTLKLAQKEIEVNEKKMLQKVKENLADMVTIATKKVYMKDK